MILPKKYAKAVRILPKGFETANEFFYHVFGDKDMIWMGQNTTHLHENPQIIDAMIECIKSREFSKYPPPEGLPELKNLILEDLGLDDEFDILITAGGTESLYLCMSALLNPKDHVVTCDPGYLIIDNFASRFSSGVIPVPIYSEECNYKLTPDLVSSHLNKNTKMVSLVDPLNPLGSCYTRREIKEFAELSIDEDVYLLHDITYREFAREHHLLAKHAAEKTITIYSFSKICGMAGLRIGAIISTREVIDSIKEVVINDLGTNVVAQKGAIAALESKKYWLDDVKNRTRENQKIIKKTVDKIDGTFIPVYPSDGNMLVIDMYEAGIKPVDVAEFLLENKIFAREGSYTSKLFGHRYLRVSFSIPKYQVEKFARCFIEAMETLEPSI